MARPRRKVPEAAPAHAWRALSVGTAQTSWRTGSVSRWSDIVTGRPKSPVYRTSCYARDDESLQRIGTASNTAFWAALALAGAHFVRRIPDS